MFEGLGSPWHFLILMIVFMATFGAKRLPEMARSLGQSARILREETRAMQQDHQQVPAVPAGGDSGPGTVGGADVAAGTHARFDVYTGRPLLSTGSAPRPGAAAATTDSTEPKA